eukprot:PhF_6_TR33845/c0_g1_i2/m.49637
MAKAPGKPNPAGVPDPTTEIKNQINANNKRCELLERMILIRVEQSQRSRLESLNLKRKIAELNEKFEHEEKLMDETCADMFQMYKKMQFDLCQKIETHEKAIEQLQKDLEESRQKLEAMKTEKDSAIAEKIKQINEQKQKMESMAIEFGEMLKATLEGMSRRIEAGGNK